MKRIFSLLLIFAIFFSLFSAEGGKGERRPGVQIITHEADLSQNAIRRGVSVTQEQLAKEFRKLKKQEGDFEAVQENAHQFDYLIDEEAIQAVCAKLGAGGENLFKGNSLVLVKFMKTLMSIRWLAISEELSREMTADEVGIIAYNIYDIVAERGIDLLREENTVLLAKLLSVERYGNKIEKAISVLPVWRLERDDPAVKPYIDFFEYESKHGDMRLREDYVVFYSSALSSLHREIDALFAEQVFAWVSLDEIESLKKGSLIQKIGEHIVAAVSRSMKTTRKELLEELPWFGRLYTSLYEWCKKYKPALLKLPPHRTKEEFEIAPTFYEPPILISKNETATVKESALEGEKKLSKKELKAKKKQEDSEIEALLRDIQGDGKGVAKGKKKNEKAAATAIDQKELAVRRSASPFADHIHKPVRHAQRVADWFRRPENALKSQGYFAPESFRNKLLNQYGVETIVENHRFPRVIDYHILRSPNATVIQQADGSFRVTLPGYRKRDIEGEVSVKEFGIFEVAYNLEPSGIRKVYHRFFRPVENYRLLIQEFGLSQAEGLLIGGSAEKEAQAYNDSWTTLDEQEGWVFNEPAPNFVTITRPGDETSYALIEMR